MSKYTFRVERLHTHTIIHIYIASVILVFRCDFFFSSNFSLRSHSSVFSQWKPRREIGCNEFFLRRDMFELVFIVFIKCLREIRTRCAPITFELYGEVVGIILSSIFLLRLRKIAINFGGIAALTVKLNQHVANRILSAAPETRNAKYIGYVSGLRNLFRLALG